MGWLDYHLHEFRIKLPRKRKFVVIGIPYDDFENDTLPGWEIEVTDFLQEPGDFVFYEYDFGDGWEHKITLEGKFLADKGSKYPLCTGGELACPPEDCGGLPGYYQLVEILADKKHQEYNDMVDWLTHHAKDYTPYDPIVTYVQMWHNGDSFI